MSSVGVAESTLIGRGGGTLRGCPTTVVTRSGAAWRGPGRGRVTAGEGTPEGWHAMLQQSLGWRIALTGLFKEVGVHAGIAARFLMPPYRTVMVDFIPVCIT